MSSELFKAIMENVGSGYGTDYINLAVRLDGTVAHVEGNAPSHKVLEEYAKKVGSTAGITDVVIDATVSEGGN